MTYILTHGGLGIATDRTPSPAKGKVMLTFEGEFADCVCVCGRFYPIIGGVAEVPASAIEGTVPVTAYATAAGRRYTCDPLGRIGEGGELIAPTADTTAEHLAALAEKGKQLEARITELSERLTALGERIDRPTFHFGGIQ